MLDFYRHVMANKLLFLGIALGTVILLTKFGDVNFVSFLPALDAAYPCLFRLGMC